MATYQRKTNQTIEAVQFTPALGDIVRRFALGELPKLPDDVPERLAWREQGGYRLDDAPISFGDYIAGNAVVARDDFERQYEPVLVVTVDPGSPVPDDVPGAVAAPDATVSVSMRSGALDDGAQAPAKRSRRASAEGA